MKRSKALRTDPEKQRAWEERARERALERARGREGQKSTALRAATAPSDFRDAGGKLIFPPAIDRNGNRIVSWRQTNPKRRRDRVAGLRGFTQRVKSLHGGKCLVCGHRAVQAHHIVPLRTLFAQGEDVAQELGGDQRNGMPVCKTCHERHEQAFKRIPRSKLPAIAIEWAEAYGFAWYVEDRRVYP